MTEETDRIESIQQKMFHAGDNEEVAQERIDDANAAVAETEQSLEKFMADPENKEGAMQLASAFLEFMGNKWFSIIALCKKTKMDEKQATQKLQMCKLFGHADVRIGNWRDDRKDLREPLWKITLSKEAKISALNGIIQYHKDALEDVELQRKSLLIELEKEKFSV